MAFCVDAGSRSLSGDGLQLKTGAVGVDASVKCSDLKSSRSCNFTGFISEQDIHYNNSFINDLSIDKVKLN